MKVSLPITALLALAGSAFGGSVLGAPKKGDLSSSTAKTTTTSANLLPTSVSNLCDGNQAINSLASYGLNGSEYSATTAGGIVTITCKTESACNKANLAKVAYDAANLSKKTNCQVQIVDKTPTPMTGDASAIDYNSLLAGAAAVGALVVLG